MRSILDLLFPKKCIGCSKIGNYFCLSCIANIKQTELVCPFCERLSLGGMTHPICRRKYGLDGLWSLGIYEKPLKNAIQKLKYKWIEDLAKVLADITIEYWAKKGTFLLDKIKKDQGKNWILVPVPLHKKRQNWRGFNQAEQLACNLGQKLDLQMENALIRVKNTKPQVSLDAYSRKQNIKGAFILNSKCQIQNSNVILVDDVWTTGSTLKECGYILKRGGVKSVWVLTIAR